MPNVDPKANVIAKDKDNLFSFMKRLLSNYTYISKIIALFKLMDYYKKM